MVGRNRSRILNRLGAQAPLGPAAPSSKLRVLSAPPDAEIDQTACVTELEEDNSGLLSQLLAKCGWDAFDRLVEHAAAAGEAGERALADALPRLPRDRQVVVAAELGDTGGSAGNETLRSIVFAPGASQDLQCAGLLALAKRNGSTATEDLLAGLASRNGAVKNYAVIGLAHVGDDSAWEPVFHRLEQLLARASRSAASPPSEVLYAVSYLSCRSGVVGDGLSRLTTLLRHRWRNLDTDERLWLQTFWPEVAPNGPPSGQVRPTERAAMRDFLREDPLFRPLRGPSLQELIAAGTPPAPHWTRVGSTAYE